MKPAEFKAARLALGCTQDELSTLLDVDPSALRRWEMEPDVPSSRKPNKFAVEIVKSMMIAKGLPA